MNYYPFHVGDYASHTAHLEPMEDLAYRRLLDLYYLRETPLPADIQATAKLVRMRSCAADVESVLREFFKLTEDGWRHIRCDAELDAMREKQQKQRDRANKRWQKPAQEPGNAEQQSAGNAGAMQPADAAAQKEDAAAREIDAVAMPPTPTPTPTPKEKKEEEARKRAPPPDRPADVPEQVWSDWLQLRRAKKAPVTQTVIDGAGREAQKAGMSLADFLAVWCRRGSQGLEAAWIKPEEHTKPSTESFRERDARAAAERVKAFTGGLCHDRAALGEAPRKPLPFERGYVDTIEGEAHEQRRIAV